MIDGIVQAIDREGVRVLHVDPGEAANRTVVTFAGSQEAVEAAAFAGIAAASETIDMRSQSGTHPRIGATDVVPFVSIGDTLMETCIGLSERVAARVGQELGIPVYLYAESARADERLSLPAIRRGEYEALEEKLARAEFAPDYGPATFNAKSGATVIGARRFLIAWNVNLNTKDVSVAREIARRLRTTGRRSPDGRMIPGRFRGLQGDGWFIDEYDRAQITFNILDFESTPIARVYEACREQAETLGVQVTGSELVGLIPGDALLEAGRFYANLRGKDTDDPISVAVQELGLDELEAFVPEQRVIELMIDD